MKKVAWIFGCGLLSRGFLIPLLHDKFWIQTFDVNPKIVQGMSDFRYPILWDGVDLEWIEPVRCNNPYLALNENSWKKPLGVTHVEPPFPDIIFTAVGVKRLQDVADVLRTHLHVEGIPIITLENDPYAWKTFQDIPGVVPYSGIASVTIPDPGRGHLAWSTTLTYADSYGYLEVPDTLQEDFPDLLPEDDMIWIYEDHDEAWDTKYLIHLASHALAAYLGILADKAYIHEVYQSNQKDRLDIAMVPILEFLQNKYPRSAAYWNSFWQFEVHRMSQPTLPDSVWRVARNPEIKLARNERLFRALNASIWAGNQIAIDAWTDAIGVAHGLTLQEEQNFQEICDGLRARGLHEDGVTRAAVHAMTSRTAKGPAYALKRYIF